MIFISDKHVALGCGECLKFDVCRYFCLISKLFVYEMWPPKNCAIFDLNVLHFSTTGLVKILVFFHCKMIKK